MAGSSNIMLNKSEESRHPCFVPDHNRNAFSFSSLNMMLAGLIIYGLYNAEVCSCSTHFLESLYHK